MTVRSAALQMQAHESEGAAGSAQANETKRKPDSVHGA